VGDDDGGVSAAPFLSALSPVAATAGQALTLQISGSGFVPCAQAYVDGIPYTTTYVSESTLEVAISSGSTRAGSLAVTVQNDDGVIETESNYLYLQVNAVAGAPVIFDYSPDNGVPGDTILIIASNLAGQSLQIQDAAGHVIAPGAIGTISWPTAGLADTVQITLPADMATGPITVENELGEYAGKIFHVGLNLTRAAGTVITSGTEYNTTNWGRASIADNLLSTSYFTAIGDCATLASCTTVPWVQITFAEEQAVARIAMRGNREYASGYDFIRGRFSLLDATNTPIWQAVYDLPLPDRDLDITLPTPITARAVQFESVEDESSEPGFGELEVFGP
jgi:hypothetical protein